jgi:hypothetical protein
MLADLRPMAGWRNKSEPMVAGGAGENGYGVSDV